MFSAKPEVAWLFASQENEVCKITFFGCVWMIYVVKVVTDLFVCQLNI